MGLTNLAVLLLFAQLPNGNGDEKISQSEILALKNRNNINSGEIEWSLVRLVRRNNSDDEPERLKSMCGLMTKKFARILSKVQSSVWSA